MKWIHLVFLAVSFSFAAALAQEPDVIVLKAPKPPAFVLKDNVARMRVDMAPDSARYPFAAQLKSVIEQSLRSDFVLSDSKPDAIVTVGIVSFEPPVGRETVETRKCMDLRSFGGRPDRCVAAQSGGKGPISIIRSAVPVNEYMQRVQYWQTSGSLGLRVKLADQKELRRGWISIRPFEWAQGFIAAVERRKSLGRKTQNNSELLRSLLEGACT